MEDAAADPKGPVSSREKKSKGEKKKKSSRSGGSRYDQPYDDYPVQQDESKGIIIPKIGLPTADEDLTSTTSPRRQSIDVVTPRRQSVSTNKDQVQGMATITPRIQKELVKPTVQKPVPVPVSVPIPVHVPKKKKGGDDDYDDDFEDYNDEFEDFDGEDTAKAKHEEPPAKLSPAKRILAEKGSKMPEKTIVVDPEYADIHSIKDTKTKKLSQLAANAAKRGKKFGTMSYSTAGDASADPRAQRLAKLRDTGIFDIQTEVFNSQFVLVPITPYEMYLRLLRAPNSNIKQMGVPVNEESVDHEMQTDPIISSDKQMQFSYGDDTALLNIMSVATSRRKEKKKDKKYAETLLEQVAREYGDNLTAGSTASTKSSADKDTSSSSLHFTAFLQQSSQLCVSLLEEKRIALSDRSVNTRSKTEQIFSPEHSWEFLGEEKGSADGANQFIANRTTCAIRFSVIQPHVLMTAHPFSADDASDLKPLTGLYAIWDVAVPSFPTWLLCGRGQPTTCCMSGAQTYIAMGGTAEGVLHLWDLRESASIHQDNDSLDMKIMKGIRRPCYSTPCHANTTAEIDTTQQHCHPIVQVEALGSSSSEWASVVSQFASIDQSGLTILWMTAQDSMGKELDGKQDFGVAPWSTMKLVRNRVLVLNDAPSASVFKNAPAGFQFSPVFSTIPNDRSTFLLSDGDGEVGKLMRYGEAPTPRHFFAPVTGKVEVPFTSTSRGRGTADLKNDPFQSDVTSLSVSRGPSDVYLILVGRRNGVVDLFESDESAPIQSWNLAAFERTGGKKADSKAKGAAAVMLVRWMPQKASCFLAVDEFGECFYFNLIKDASYPVLQDSLGIERLSSSAAVDLSDCRSGSTTIRIASVEHELSVLEKSVRVRKLWGGLVEQNVSVVEEEKDLRDSMAVWAARNVADHVVQVFKAVPSRK